MLFWLRTGSESFDQRIIICIYCIEACLLLCPTLQYNQHCQVPSCQHQASYIFPEKTQSSKLKERQQSDNNIGALALINCLCTHEKIILSPDGVFLFFQNNGRSSPFCGDSYKVVKVLYSTNKRLRWTPTR